MKKYCKDCKHSKLLRVGEWGTERYCYNPSLHPPEPELVEDLVNGDWFRTRRNHSECKVQRSLNHLPNPKCGYSGDYWEPPLSYRIKTFVRTHVRALVRTLGYRKD